MRRNIFLTLCCFACIGFTSCSDEYTDATSKHVYGENENPYMRVDIDAQMSVTAPLEVNGEHAYTINLADYADKFEEKMGMSLDAVMSGLDNGTTVFYPINATRNQWLKTAYNAETGWYFNSANQPCEANDENSRATVTLNQSARTLTVELTEGGIVAGTVLSINVGFAVNGPDYDDYLRFTFDVSVTDPTVSVESVNLPNTDYTAVDLMLTNVEANLTAVFDMSLTEFIAAFDAGTIRFYAANPSTGTWDTESAYTGEEPAGYWFDATGAVCAYPGTVCANFKPDSESVSESCVKLCCMPGLTAGDSYMCSFGFVDTTDSSKFFRYIVTCNIVE